MHKHTPSIACLDRRARPKHECFKGLLDPSGPVPTNGCWSSCTLLQPTGVSRCLCPSGLRLQWVVWCLDFCRFPVCRLGETHTLDTLEVSLLKIHTGPTWGCVKRGPTTVLECLNINETCSTSVSPYVQLLQCYYYCLLPGSFLGHGSAVFPPRSYESDDSTFRFKGNSPARTQGVQR